MWLVFTTLASVWKNLVIGLEGNLTSRGEHKLARCFGNRDLSCLKENEGRRGDCSASAVAPAVDRILTQEHQAMAGQTLRNVVVLVYRQNLAAGLVIRRLDRLEDVHQRPVQGGCLVKNLLSERRELG